MGISDIIAGFIYDMLHGTDGVIELSRIGLAERFNCAPSQINYVLSTRFSPEHGFIVESRRGGGGYIRIIRVRMDRQTLIMHALNAVGDSIDARSASAILQNIVNSEAVNECEARLIAAAAGEAALRPLAQEERDAVRASILKQCFLELVR